MLNVAADNNGADFKYILNVIIIISFTLNTAQ